MTHTRKVGKKGVYEELGKDTVCNELKMKSKSRMKAIVPEIKRGADLTLLKG